MFECIERGYRSAMHATTPRTVLITGASRGIGREAALQFAARGDRLVLAARDPSALRSVVEECLVAGASGAIAQPTDIGDKASVAELFDAAVAEFGSVDVVVQNASIAAFGQLTDIPSDVFDTVIAVNVLGASDVCRTAVRHFRERGAGRLIVVGSLLGHAAVPFMGPYVISKFAVSALVRILRQETRSDRAISVHGIYPGAVDTLIYPTSANYFGRLARVLPVNDPPAKIARAIVAAASSARSSERQVGIANWPMLLGYRLAPVAFNALVKPLMRTLSFGRTPLTPTPGNAFDPTHTLTVKE